MTESIPSLIERIDAELEGVTFPDRRGEMLREARAELSRLSVPDPSTSAQDLSKGPLPAPACPKCGKDRVTTITTNQVKHRHCLDCGHDWTVTDSVSPLPEEIARLIAKLEARAEDRAYATQGNFTRETFYEWQAAAALQRLAEENAWLKDADRVHAGVGKVREARIAELEAERDEHKKAYLDLVEETRALRNEAYEQGNREGDSAIRAKTIEECAIIADKYWAREVASQIRALIKPEAGGGE